MRVWMIHEVTEDEILSLRKLSSEENIFVWDDAVLSQYEAILQLQDYKNILAVSTNIATKATEQWNNTKAVWYEPTSISHKRWHEENDARAFMTWWQIKELSEFCEIAAHGYNHTRPIRDIKVGVMAFIEECKKIEQDFLNRLSKKPNTYVYPYNDNLYWTDAILHKHFGWNTLGKERLDAKKYFSGEIKI